MKLVSGYEAEQKELEEKIVQSENRLSAVKQNTGDLRLLLSTLQQCTEIMELDRTLVNKLIQRIEVHNNDSFNGHCHVKVDIFFTGTGIIDTPTEILALMDELRKEEDTAKIYSA